MRGMAAEVTDGRNERRGKAQELDTNYFLETWRHNQMQARCRRAKDWFLKCKPFTGRWISGFDKNLTTESAQPESDAEADRL